MTTTSPTRQIGGYLQNNSSTVTGVLHVTNDTTCFPFNAATSNTPADPENIPVTGTLTGTTLSLTSSAVNSQVLTINGTVNSSNNAITTGTYTITGGCANGSAGSITGNQDTSLTSTMYTGTMTSNGSVGTTNITHGDMIEGGPDVNGNGLFILSNGITTPPFSFSNSGTTCFITGNISPLTVVSGNYVFITLLTDTGSLTLTGSTTFAAQTISGTYSVSGGPCSGDSGNFTMTHP
jgi:hypothetical protein